MCVCEFDSDAHGGLPDRRPVPAGAAASLAIAVRYIQWSADRSKESVIASTTTNDQQAVAATATYDVRVLARR